MLTGAALNKVIAEGRRTSEDVKAFQNDPQLGVLGDLPGTWKNTGAFEHHGWNMIALPFGTPGQLGDFRLLLNQLDETLEVDLVDLGVPHRDASNQDQHLTAPRHLQ